MADDSFDYMLQLFWKSSCWVNQLWHTGAGQLPLSMLQAPLKVLKQLLKGGFWLTAEGMHLHFQLWHFSAQWSQPERHFFCHTAEGDAWAFFTCNRKKKWRYTLKRVSETFCFKVPFKGTCVVLENKFLLRKVVLHTQHYIDMVVIHILNISSSS